MLDKYRQLKTEENRVNMVKARSEYKSLLRKCKFDYEKLKTKQFVDANYKNARLYWSLLK